MERAAVKAAAQAEVVKVAEEVAEEEAWSNAGIASHGICNPRLGLAFFACLDTLFKGVETCNASNFFDFHNRKHRSRIDTCRN